MTDEMTERVAAGISHGCVAAGQATSPWRHAAAAGFDKA